jgi:hypothetical protein
MEPPFQRVTRPEVRRAMEIIDSMQLSGFRAVPRLDQHLIGAAQLIDVPQVLV